MHSIHFTPLFDDRLKKANLLIGIHTHTHRTHWNSAENEETQYRSRVREFAMTFNTQSAETRYQRHERRVHAEPISGSRNRNITTLNVVMFQKMEPFHFLEHDQKKYGNIIDGKTLGKSNVFWTFSARPACSSFWNRLCWFQILEPERKRGGCGGVSISPGRMEGGRGG